MARSKNCLKCYYCGNIRGTTGTNYKNDFTCDYMLVTGKMVKPGDKGDDPDHCKLFKAKDKPRRSQLLF